jgi:3-hydroxyisobutyrate dehydrogenase-like beta-hydroxyacid dehydrogenase
MKVGFIGTGNMGNRMVPKLLDAGHEVVVNDLNRAATEHSVSLGAVWADNARDVARASDVVFAMVASPSDVEKLVTTPDTGLLAGLSKGKVFVDLTTSHPAVTRKLAALIRERTGAEMLDCPVSAGGGVCLVVGGDKAAFDQVEPLLNAMAAHTFYMGDSGSGNIAKLCRQYAHYVGFWAMCEALVMAQKNDVNPQVVAELMQLSGAVPATSNWPSRIFKHDFATPETATARLDIVQKDVDLAIQWARQSESPATIGLGADDIMRRAQAQGWGRHDFFVAVQVIEALAGARLDEPAGVPLG